MLGMINFIFHLFVRFLRERGENGFSGRRTPSLSSLPHSNFVHSTHVSASPFSFLQYNLIIILFIYYNTVGLFVPTYQYVGISLSLYHWIYLIPYVSLLQCVYGSVMVKWVWFKTRVSIERKIECRRSENR